MTVDTGFGLSPFGISPFGDPIGAVPGLPADGMLDFQFELDGYLFGRARPLFVERFDPGASDWTGAWSDVPGGGRRAGRDQPAAETWSFDLGIDESSPETALAALEDAESAFRTSKLRGEYGTVSVLRYRLGGRVRRVYGRARRWAAPPTNTILSGHIPVTATFDLADRTRYDDELNVQTMSLIPGEVGGLEAPLAEPLSTVNVRSKRQNQFVIEGTEPTWVTVTFQGPLTNPRLALGGMVVGISGALAYDEAITFNPAPWARTVTGRGGAGVAGNRISRETVMNRMRLAPGVYEATFTGTDQTGMGTATVSWRAARASL